MSTHKMPDKRKPSSSITGSSPYAKRSRPSYTEDDQDDEETPRTVTPYERPRNHPVFGQKSAFPGLDVGKGDELFYGPAEDGLEYLRMVRSEANSLPLLFTAPSMTTEPLAKAPEIKVDEPVTHNPQVEDLQGLKKEDDEEQDEKDTKGRIAPARKGVYRDGVYLSLTTVEEPTGDNKSYSDTQASYHNLLHHRFLLMRSILKCTPPSEAIAALDESHPISLPRRSKAARKEWRRLLFTVDPQTVQLACMDMDSVLGALGIMARLMSENVRSGNPVLVRRIGAWAWGLLGKCREVGQLSTEEVGEIRDLGKRAVKILRKMKEEEEMGGEKGLDEDDGYLSHEESDVENPVDANDSKEREHGEENEGDPSNATLDQPGVEKGGDADNDDDDDAGELEMAKARLQTRLLGSGNGSPAQDVTTAQEGDEAEMREEEDRSAVDVSTQTRAMLDMIITVVGEHYGQRDLLEAREIWDAGPFLM